MSYAPPPPNPFQAPQFPVGSQAALKPGGQEKLEYMRAYNFIFENPNWMMNVLWGFLCILSSAIIPVVGQLVFLGYQFEVVEALHLTRGGRYPDFDVNRFADYLGRSIWPFLVQLVASLVIVPLILVLYFAGFLLVAGGAAAGGEDAGGVIAMLLIPVVILLMLGAMLLMTIFMLPMILRAGLSQDFGQAFNFGWVTSFVKKMWLEMLLSTLFLMATALVLVPVGLLAFCIGVYAAVVIVMLAQSHFYYQLYAIFLARGGEPIPLKPKNLPPAMAPQY